MVVGPFQRFQVGGGVAADLYLLRYDADGRLRSPRTERLLKDAVRGATDVFLFSHGWNNVFDEAVERYRSFITGYIAQRQTFALARPATYKPVLIGVVWPSTSFVLPWEKGPEIAAATGPDAGPNSAAAAQTEEMLRFVSASLPADVGAELAELVDGRTSLDPDDARRVAEILLAGMPAEPEPDGGTVPPSPNELLEACAKMAEPAGGLDPAADPDAFGVAGAPAAAGPVAAGGFSLDPRNLLRTATVWKMKDRAGTVGAVGVGPLVRHILARSDARLHLIGHSFGARVLLSALAIEPLARPARSMLLLQAAVNRWCFAANVAGTGRAGGYRPVLARVEQPILATFSARDTPLTKFFHLAVRGGSLGEPKIAALGDEERYGALGGYGPAGLDTVADTQRAVRPDARGYRLDGVRRVVAIDGGVEIDGQPAIDGHGDISNPTTWWALHCLTSPG